MQVAAAVAAGLVPFALGSETLGSIVSPATVCSVTGLRPTFGRVLAVDREEQRYVGDDEASALMRGTYREGFSVPGKG